MFLFFSFLMVRHVSEVTSLIGNQIIKVHSDSLYKPPG